MCLNSDWTHHACWYLMKIVGLRWGMLVFDESGMFVSNGACWSPVMHIEVSKGSPPGVIF